MAEHYTPEERIEFFDFGSQRQMMFANFHSGGLWLFYKHPDGQWVSLRQPTLEDLAMLVGNVSARDARINELEVQNRRLQIEVDTLEQEKAE